ncbi:MAG: RICIN domain-containing protein [Clostridia bacterium]|nr:RICIN domain-containing protein [Clostridia bacterium]
MKKLGSILLTFAVLLTLCAGALPVYAEDASISITSAKTVLMVGQSYAPTVTVSPSGTSFTLSSSNSSVVSVDNTYKTMTGLQKGTAVITASCTDSSGNVLTDSITVKVRAPTGLMNDTDYYIMNCNTELLLSLETASDANNVNISGRERSDSPLSQWTVLSQSNGTTRLQSVYSSTGRVIFMSGTNAILYNSTSAYTKFDLHRIESGTYQGKYLIRFNNKYLTMDSTGDVYLSSSLVAGSYWCFMAVEKGYADIYSHQYTGYDTTTNNSDFYFTFQELGYSAYMSVNETAEYAYEYLPDDHIFVFRGHGEAGRIAFRDSNGTTTDRIFANTAIVFGTGYSICSRYENADDQSADTRVFLADNALANLRCALLLGCKTGVDYSYGAKTYNLVNAYFEKGAHFVVGTSMSVDSDNSDDFLKGFLDALSDSSNKLSDCVQAGIINAGTNTKYETDSNLDGRYPVVTVGDSNQYID